MTTDPEDRRRSPPQFSLKLLLIVTSVSAFLSAVVRVKGGSAFFTAFIFAVSCWIAGNLFRLVRLGPTRSDNRDEPWSQV